MHGVQVAQDHDSRPVAPIEVRFQCVATPILPRHSGSFGAQVAHRCLGEVHHSIDGSGVETGAFDARPLSDPRGDFLGVKIIDIEVRGGEVAVVGNHLILPGYSAAAVDVSASISSATVAAKRERICSIFVWLSTFRPKISLT